MPATTQNPIGHGRIVWLGVNQKRGEFSIPRNTLRIHEDGVDDDMYRGMWRKIAGHDVDYIATDGVAKGDQVLNLRQITIIEEGEVTQAGVLAGATIERGMLRENIAVRFTPQSLSQKFSGLPPLSRMVINHGEKNAKVLILTEQNGPCRTICQPMAVHFGGGPELAENLKAHLGGNRGQMAMVRSGKTEDVRVGDPFLIFPPMT